MRAINIRPNMTWRIALASLPFLILLLAYIAGSDARLAANPNDKLLPSFNTMGEALGQYVLQADPRTGVYLMWSDTTASLSRLLSALAISTSIALAVGLFIGVLPLARATFGPVVAVASMVPPLALLPIFFIVMGLGEASKITLIVVGTTLKLARDLALRVEEIPREQIIKAQTLGASTWQIAMRVVLPQMLPRLIDAVRLEIGPAWLFLIAAEAIAADSGLGYRIFLVRRYLSMDVIIPYVVWITILAFMMDVALRASARQSLPVVCGREVGMTVITFKNVWKEYGDHVVLERLDLEVAPRSFLALVGPSGCGKTTFLRMLLGEEEADERRHPRGRSAAHGRTRQGSRRRLSALFRLPAFDGA